MLNNLLVILNSPFAGAIIGIVISLFLCGIFFIVDHITKKDISEVIFNSLIGSVCIVSFVFCTFVLVSNFMMF